jgi:hypothetical protein
MVGPPVADKDDEGSNSVLTSQTASSTPMSIDREGGKLD